MTESGLDLGLSDPTRAGVYFVTSDDLDSLGMAARDAGLQVRRIDLAGCDDKPTLLLRIATALDFPGTFGRNWDALSDNLRDLEWMPGDGYALLFDQAGELRDAEEADFDTLLDILDEASMDWTARALPFWAFLALPQSAFDEMDAAAEKSN
ncbi:barstar family protein [Lysobacter sp. CFH 32150]|uniref:barstar family protein n=1 Tax=Lysobacter sp. CFH 32150 TaxID=2927128 RepID=UPI001FA7271C|nr:barstar family protein [Lysobacter sp. CFH 32150]MCI4566570.1 barstar family protein [Lysobacter sp. CFH 32150]